MGVAIEKGLTMAFIGPWGQFLHIPKCAGLSMRGYLERTYKIEGVDNKGMHDLPPVIENAFTVIRHPVKWLVSFYQYYQKNFWKWDDLPPYVDNQFNFANGLFWPQYVEAITTRNPGAVGKVFDYYCRDGVKVYKMEELDTHFPGISTIHKTGHKPFVSDEQWNMMCEAEAGTMEKYGYANDDNG